MTEEEVKLRSITPALVAAGWDTNHISMETKITDGRINLRGNLVSRGQPKRADYILWLNSSTPIAIVEAKDDSHTVSHGLQQAMEYAQMMDIDDGFLAPFRVINVRTNIGEDWRPYKGQVDRNGNVIADRIYSNSDFDYNLILDDRTQQVAQEITQYLKQTDRMQKTIVFCANEDHAERMRMALVNCNADMVQKNPDYVVRIEVRV